MHHEMLTQRTLFCIDVMAKRVTLSQHFVPHVVLPLGNSMPSRTSSSSDEILSSSIPH
jgi:hypothetical protein